ncbi:MAG: flavin reductase family protein [Myxococcota bacterium]
MIDPTLFKQALSRFPSGVTVIAARHAGEVRAMTVSAFSSVSLSPPLVLACVDLRAATLPLIRAAQRFGVSVLAADQEALSSRFAGFGDAEPTWDEIGPSAVLAGALAQLDCAVHQIVEAGDHAVVIGRVEGARVAEGEPLAYWRGGYRTICGGTTVPK